MNRNETQGRTVRPVADGGSGVLPTYFVTQRDMRELREMHRELAHYEAKARELTRQVLSLERRIDELPGEAYEPGFLTVWVSSGKVVGRDVGAVHAEPTT